MKRSRRNYNTERGEAATGREQEKTKQNRTEQWRKKKKMEKNMTKDMITRSYCRTMKSLTSKNSSSSGL